MGDADWFCMNFSLNVEDSSSSNEVDPNAVNLEDNQEVKPFAIEDTKKPQTAGVEQLANKEKILPPRIQDLIGLIICKECSGVYYLGTVVSYNAERKWFRIEYDDEGSEDMEEQDVRKYLASAVQLADQIYRSRIEERKQKLKPKKSVSRKKTNRKPRCKKSDTSGRRADGTYIPLAYRSTKKDNYYWY